MSRPERFASATEMLDPVITHWDSGGIRQVPEDCPGEVNHAACGTWTRGMPRGWHTLAEISCTVCQAELVAWLLRRDESDGWGDSILERARAMEYGVFGDRQKPGQ